MELMILGAMSGELFHCVQAMELKNLQEVIDLKRAICKAKGLQNSSMLRLFEEKVGGDDTMRAVPLQDDLPLQELFVRKGPSADFRLRALVVLPDDLEPRRLMENEVNTHPLQMLQHCAKVITHLPPELQGDRSLVLEAVSKNWKVLRFCNSDFQDDLEIVRQAMLQNVNALEFASERLRGLKSLILEAISFNTAALQHATLELREDEELLKEALSWNPFALRFASPKLTNCKDLVMRAVKGEGLALLYAGPEMREDREVVLAAVQQNGSALVFASPELRKDRELVRQAVQQNGQSLQHASDELQLDPELQEVAGAADSTNPTVAPTVSQSRGDICSCGFLSPRPMRQGYVSMPSFQMNPDVECK
eukprot:symbB.v1.2.023411.t1/scaffold2136.1/size88155/3